MSHYQDGVDLSIECKDNGIQIYIPNSEMKKILDYKGSNYNLNIDIETDEIKDRKKELEESYKLLSKYTLDGWIFIYAIMTVAIGGLFIPIIITRKRANPLKVTKEGKENGIKSGCELTSGAEGKHSKTKK